MYSVKTRYIIWFIFITGGLAVTFIVIDLLKKFQGPCSSKKHDPEISQLFEDSQFASFQGERVVHLDMKGAPPSIDYLKKIFPLFRTLGMSSVLIEYEDVFPYKDKFMRAINAYSADDIKTLLKIAKENNLNIIPLVQTFGHLEFLLKTRKFSYLREDFNYPESICPSHNYTFSFLTNLLDEIIEAHPNISYIHIGCDEVFHLGLCKKCKEKMSINHWRDDELFLDHVSRLAKYIRSKYPSIIPLMWDDQLRSISLDKLKKFNIGTIIEPMVWFYQPVISFPPRMWETYSQIFTAVWIASSFKGATGPDQIITNISFHVENQISWMYLMREYGSSINFKGVVITGWQRYDHFAVLCELLPVSIPSLVHVSLILDGSHSKRVNESQVRNVIACGVKNTLPESCEFPGANIYFAVHRFSQLRNKIDGIFSSPSVRGYLTTYNVKTKYFGRPEAEKISSWVEECRTSLNRTETILKEALGAVYDKYTITEWMRTNIQLYASRLNHMSVTLRKLANITEWGPRYRN